MSTQTTGYLDCPIAHIRAETSHERVLDLLVAFLSCPTGTTRAFDDPFGRAVGFYDVEKGHLHYATVSVLRSAITELRESSPNEVLGAGWAFEDRPWRRFQTAQSRRELFGSPTLVRKRDDSDPCVAWVDRQAVWEDQG